MSQDKRPAVSVYKNSDTFLEDGFGKSYDVERKGNLVSIGLGFVPAFEVPRDTAIKLAALILKAAGCGVTISSNCLTASWRKLDG